MASSWRKWQILNGVALFLALLAMAMINLNGVLPGLGREMTGVVVFLLYATLTVSAVASLVSARKPLALPVFSLFLSTLYFVFLLLGQW